METIDLIIPTVAGREEALQRCIDSFMALSSEKFEIVPKPFVDPRPQIGNMTRLVALRNFALDHATSEWAFLIDDDDVALPPHSAVCLIERMIHPDATAIIPAAHAPQDQDPNGNGLWQSISCSFINVERFRQVGWMDPTSYGGGGEDFFTRSTMQVRGHKIIFVSEVTWQIGQDQPSVTRERPVVYSDKIELRPPVKKVESYCQSNWPGGCRSEPYCWVQGVPCMMAEFDRLAKSLKQVEATPSPATGDTLAREQVLLQRY